MDIDSPNLCPKVSDNTLADAHNPDRANSVPKKRKTLDCDSTIAKIVENKTFGHDDGQDVSAKSFSVPEFLRAVLMEEFAGDGGASGGRHRKLMVIATHAIMLECGFLGFDKESDAVVNGFQPPHNWPSGDRFTMSLFYTLPAKNGAPIKNVVLEFESSGESISVCGQLEGKSEKSTVHVNEDQLITFTNVVIENIGGLDENESPGKEVFTFWRTVKDDLALPLLKILVSNVNVADLANNVGPLCYKLNRLALSESKFHEESVNESNDTPGSCEKAVESVARDRLNNADVAFKLGRDRRKKGCVAFKSARDRRNNADVAFKPGRGDRRNNGEVEVPISLQPYPFPISVPPITWDNDCDDQMHEIC